MSWLRPKPNLFILKLQILMLRVLYYHKKKNKRLIFYMLLIKMEKLYSKRKMEEFQHSGKTKCFHCIGRFQKVLFCSDFEKKMGTIRISSNSGGIWVLPTGSILSVGFALKSTRGGDLQPPRRTGDPGAKFPLLCPRPTPGCSLRWVSRVAQRVMEEWSLESCRRPYRHFSHPTPPLSSP